MKAYVTTAQIAASAERVWVVLTDGGAYRHWNPEIVAIDGSIALGARIVAHVRLGDGALRSVPQRITVLEAPHRMEWTGGLPFGLFVGRRTFTLTPVAEGVEFRMHLHMSGILAAMILRSVGNRQPEIDKFAAALKSRVESLAEGGGAVSPR